MPDGITLGILRSDLADDVILQRAFPGIPFCMWHTLNNQQQLGTKASKATHLIFNQDGVHTPAQASQAEGVQIFRCGPVPGLALHPQALLQQCCDQVLPNVHGVSTTSIERIERDTKCAQLHRPNAVSCSNKDVFRVVTQAFHVFLDHPLGVQLRGGQFLDDAMVQSRSRPRLSAMGLRQLGGGTFLIPDI